MFRFRSNLSIAGGLAFGNKMDAPVYVSQEGGVVGLNFHQSKEVLISDSINGSAFSVGLHFIMHSVVNVLVVNRLYECLWYLYAYLYTTRIDRQLNGAAQTIAPGLIGVDYDDLTDEMKTPSCWSDVRIRNGNTRIYRALYM